MDYSHAKFQVYQVCKKGIKEGGPNQPPPRLPTASNTLGLIGLTFYSNVNKMSGMGLKPTPQN